MSGVERAWGWVAALRAGATTPWSAWAETVTDPGHDRPWLPGAQQLELLRHVNDATGGRTSTDLAERILAASAPGRGRPDLLLVGAEPERPFGPRPVDPATLRPAELVRVAAGLIAEDLVAAGVPGPDPRRWTSIRRPWASSYALAGDAWLVPAALDDLARRGRPPAPRPQRAVVLAADLETLLVHAWTARSFDEGGAPWADWLAGYLRVDRLPPRADVVKQAGHWAAVVGKKQVTITLTPDEAARAIRVRRLAPAPTLSGAAVDLARLVGGSLALLAGHEDAARLLRDRLAPRLDRIPGAPLALPEEARVWAQERADRMITDLARGGYAFAGDPQRLVPSVGTRPGGEPVDSEVLALAIDLLVTPIAPADPTEED